MITVQYQSLITCCPLISRGYQSLALGLVDSVSAPDATVSRSINRKWGRRVVARSDREPGGRPELRDTVVFASTPYLALREKQPGRRSTDSMQSVLTYRYGSDLAASRSAVQVLSETQKWLKKETVHVARMGSLLIGPGTLHNSVLLLCHSTCVLKLIYVGSTRSYAYMGRDAPVRHLQRQHCH